ncbi:MAG: PEP-CTERM sorting domain-containing protein [Parvibaculum sp.]|nr:PEP-CTERM sorting domain-containing protein [Parvibaculum sp.]
MKMRTPHTLAALTLGLFIAFPAQAALYDRGGGLVYDDVLNITWLGDANYAKTSGYNYQPRSGYAFDGRMPWDIAKGWVGTLSFYDSVRNVTYTDWRLPTASNQNPCSGYFCTSSEMGHMFYNNFGGTGGHDFNTGTNTANIALFTNVQFAYWSGTTDAFYTTSYAWMFRNFGYQSLSHQDGELFAWAVRPGDVASVAAPIPEPETYALMLAGFGFLGVMALRRKQKTIA